MAAGAEARVAISDSVILDFAGLFGSTTGEKQAPEKPVEPLKGEGEYKTLATPKKPVERLTDGLQSQQAVQLHLEAKREQEERQRTLEIYRTYQENIKTSSQLQTEILKGIKAGESVYSLFLKATKAISLMTSNSLFYRQAEADTIAIYGEGLLEKAPLQKQLTDTQQRLQRLREALNREIEADAKERIQRAIKAHEAKIADLESLIERERITA